MALKFSWKGRGEGRLDSGKYSWLAYFGSVKREKELEGEGSPAGWRPFFGFIVGFIAGGRFCFFHHSSIKTKPIRGL
jgi:hypothetical protein